MTNLTSVRYSSSELRWRAFIRISTCIHSMWEETGNSDTRLLIEPLIPNSFVLAGISKRGSDYREHVVPRVLICERSHAMFQAGATIGEVAEFISKYLKVVLISKEEQRYLDVDLGLKKTMPLGWSFESGGVFDRLVVAGIDFDLVEC